MSTYRIGLALASSEIDIKNGPTVGAEAQTGKKGGILRVLIPFGLVFLAYVVIPKQKQLGSGS